MIHNLMFHRNQLRSRQENLSYVLKAIPFWNEQFLKVHSNCFFFAFDCVKIFLNPFHIYLGQKYYAKIFSLQLKVKIFKELKEERDLIH